MKAKNTNADPSQHRDLSERARRRVRHVMSVLPTSSDICSLVQRVPISLQDREEPGYPAYAVAVRYIASRWVSRNFFCVNKLFLSYAVYIEL